MFARRIHERFRNRARELRCLDLYAPTSRSYVFENDDSDAAITYKKSDKRKNK